MKLVPLPGAPGLLVPADRLPRPAPATPAPAKPAATSSAEAAKLAEGRRILAELGARKASVTPPARSAEENARIDREHARLKAAAASDKMVSDVLTALGLPVPTADAAPVSGFDFLPRFAKVDSK